MRAAMPARIGPLAIARTRRTAGRSAVKASIVRHFTGVLGGHYSRFGMFSGIAGFVAGGVFTIIQKSNGGKRLPKAGLTTSLALTAMGLLLVFFIDLAVSSRRARDNPPARRFWPWADAGDGVVEPGARLVPTGARSGSASLIVERPYQWGDLILTAMGLLLVFEVGKLRPMRPFHCDLEPGEHTLQIRIDSTGSPVHELLIQAGQETRCQVHYPPGGPRMIPEGWLALTQDNGDH